MKVAASLVVALVVCWACHGAVLVTQVEPSVAPVDVVTNVVLRGTGFNASLAVTFVGGGNGTVRSALGCVVVSSTQLNCSTPAFPLAGAAQVTVGDAATPFFFYATDFVQMRFSGPTSGNTSVVVKSSSVPTGSGSVPVCVLVHRGSGNETQFAGNVTSSSEMTCTTPSGLAAGSFDLQVTFNGVQRHNTSTVGFVAYAMQLGALTPNLGLVSGGTLVMASGTGFVQVGDSPLMELSNGLQKWTVSGTSRTDGSMLFNTSSFQGLTIANGQMATLSVVVRPNGQQAILAATPTTPPTFRVYKEHGQLDEVQPNTLPAIKYLYGGQTDSDWGLLFVRPADEKFFVAGLAYTRLTLSNGTVYVLTALAQTTQRMFVQVPELWPYTGDVVVEVSLNGQQWASGTTILDAPNPSKLRIFQLTGVRPVASVTALPPWVPTSGGTQLLLTGPGMQDLPVLATQQAPTMYVTQTGTGFLGTTLSISASRVFTAPVAGLNAQGQPQLVDGQPVTVAVALSTSPSFQFFTYVASLPSTVLRTTPMPNITWVAPTRVPAGLAVPMRVYGDRWTNTSVNTVLFGGATHTTPARFVNTTLLEAVSKALPEGTYSLQVSPNADASQATGVFAIVPAGSSTPQSIPFEAVAPVVQGISPRSGPVNGTTRVTVSGTKFLNSEVAGSLRVRFGAAGTAVVVQAESETRIVVDTPNLGSLPASLAVQVSSNAGATFVSALSGGDFVAYVEPQWMQASPNTSIALAGASTTVQLSGVFASVVDEPRVRVQDSTAAWQHVVSATKTSATVLSFGVPGYNGTQTLPALLDVHVALNGQQFRDSGVRLFAYAQPTVTGVSPDKKQPGETVSVTITGTNFVNTGFVRVELGQGNVYNVSRLTSTEIVVLSPANDLAGVRNVRVSLDAGQHIAPANGVVFSIVKDPIVCPGNTESEAPETIEDCVCLPLFYSPTGKGGIKCEPCPANGVCPGGLRPPQPLPGFFSTGGPQEYRFTACAASVACPGGNNTGCNIGYKEVLCGTCEDGYYKLGDQCAKCQDGSQATVGFMAILFVAYLFFVRGQVRTKPKQRGRVANLAITHLQVMSTFGEFRLQWPASVRNVFSYFSIANFNLDAAAPECTTSPGQYTYETRFWLTMALPVAVVLGLLVRIATEYVHAAWAKNNATSFKEAHPWFCAPPKASQSGLGLLLSKARFGLSRLITESSPVDETTWRFFVNEILFSMALLYISVSTRVLEVFDCTEIREGVAVLDASPTIVCWQPGGDHAKLILPASVFLVLYVVGTPAAFFAVMWFGRDRGKRSEPRFRQRFGCVYGKFAIKRYWFGGLILMRKALVVAVKLFATSLPALQGLMGILVLGGATLLQYSFRPFKAAKQNQLESVLLLEGVLLLVAGMVFVTGSGVNESTAAAWETVTVLLAISVLIACVYYLGLDVFLTATEQKRARSRSPEMERSLGELVAALTPLLKPDQVEKARVMVEGHLSVQEIDLVTRGAMAACATNNLVAAQLDTVQPMVNKHVFAQLVTYCLLSDEDDAAQALLDVLVHLSQSKMLPFPSRSRVVRKNKGDPSIATHASVADAGGSLADAERGEESHAKAVEFQPLRKDAGEAVEMKALAVDVSHGTYEHRHAPTASDDDELKSSGDEASTDDEHGR